MVLQLALLMIGGFVLGYFIAKYQRWYTMWLFYTAGNLCIVFAVYKFADSQKMMDLSLYFSLFAAAMFIGLYSGDGTNKNVRK